MQIFYKLIAENVYELKITIKLKIMIVLKWS